MRQSGTSPRRRRGAPTPAGKHAQNAPRLIGYAILLVALLLIAIGSAMAHECPSQSGSVSHIGPTANGLGTDDANLAPVRHR